jgi:hypothetical protein
MADRSIIMSIIIAAAGFMACDMSSLRHVHWL